MFKKDLRKKFIEKRKALSDHQIEKLNDLILVHFQKIPFEDIRLVHSYLASEKLKEPDTFLILRYLAFRFPHIQIAAPKIDTRNTSMQNYLIHDFDHLQQNTYGIDEPVGGELVSEKDIDLVLVPLLCFDEKGYRVGYGKGYYDRFLANCRRDAIKVGLCFFDAEPSIEDTGEFDIPLDYCCTPHRLYTW